MVKKLSLIASIVVMSLLTGCGENNANQQPAATNDTTVEQTAPTDSNQQANPQAQPATAAQSVPQEVNDFVQKYFPGTSIMRVETDNDHGGVEYDVILSDGTEIDFDANNLWDNVDCHTKAVPAALVPEAIASYVKAKHQSLDITKIDKELAGYDIELSNGLDLKFNKSGQFMGGDK